MRRPFFRSSLIRFTLVSVFAFSLVLGWTPIAQSQLPSLPTTSTNPFTLPDGVSRYGEYETSVIRSPLDNKVLFEVTSPTILNRDKVPDDKLPIEIRANEVNERLWRVLSRTIEAKQAPTATIATLNKRPIIQISDNQSSRPIQLVTVTEPDADFNGKSSTELAEEWRKVLQDEMVRFRQMTTPEVLRQRIGQAAQILLGLLISTVVIWLLRRGLTHRQDALETQYRQQSATVEEVEKAQESEFPEETEAEEIADLRSRFLATLQHQFSLRRRLDFYKFLKWALLWIFILMWYVGVARILSIVPVLMKWSFYLWASPIVLLVLWFGISLAIRISTSLIDRLMHSWRINPLLPFGEAQRVAIRSTTIAQALKGLITFVLVIVGIIWTLDVFNVPTSSILAGGAVIGLAISFGSQSLIKDLVNGCLILVEDQFAVGDVIQIDQQSGLVENLNLRVTQLRNSEGHLITIPNSTIANVCNLTRLWSRIDFSIVVAYENDPKRVLDVLKQVSQQMYDDPQWRDRLPELPEVLGIDDLSHTGMLVRVWIKTAPMEQWSVGREFRLRVRQAFEANQIQIGKPQLITYHADFNQISQPGA